MVLQVQQREVEVRTGLDEVVEIDQVGLKRASYRKRATARFVTIERHGEAFLDKPEVGGAWCPLTVRARLERMNEAYNRQPRVRPGIERSCMPTPLRGWGDAAKTKEERESVKDRALDDADLDAANQIVDVLGADERPVAWAIARRKKDRWLGRKLGVHHQTAAKRKQEMLSALALKWTLLGLRPDGEDVRRALQYLYPQE
ncbi:hypothetical protein [Reyranella sp.]|uniref:hypothetical protein n=1 Tax=Reyranella sp. TaxID=1929291 RepID=UPI003C7ABA72